MKEAVVVCICNKSFCSIHIVTLYHTTTNNCNTLRSIKAFRIFSFPSLSFFRLITTTVSPYPVSFTITQLAALAHFLAHTIFLFNYQLPQSQSSASPNHKLFTVSLTHISKLTVPLLQVEWEAKLFKKFIHLASNFLIQNLPWVPMKNYARPNVI